MKKYNEYFIMEKEDWTFICTYTAELAKLISKTTKDKIKHIVSLVWDIFEWKDYTQWQEVMKSHFVWPFINVEHLDNIIKKDEAIKEIITNKINDNNTADILWDSKED